MNKVLVRLRLPLAAVVTRPPARVSALSSKPQQTNTETTTSYNTRPVLNHAPLLMARKEITNRSGGGGTSSPPQRYYSLNGRVQIIFFSNKKRRHARKKTAAKYSYCSCPKTENCASICNACNLPATTKTEDHPTHNKSVLDTSKTTPTTPEQTPPQCYLLPGVQCTCRYSSDEISPDIPPVQRVG